MLVLKGMHMQWRALSMRRKRPIQMQLFHTVPVARPMEDEPLTSMPNFNDQPSITRWVHAC
jgi:hypothetical protein